MRLGRRSIGRPPRSRPNDAVRLLLEWARSMWAGRRAERLGRFPDPALVESPLPRYRPASRRVPEVIGGPPRSSARYVSLSSRSRRPSSRASSSSGVSRSSGGATRLRRTHAVRRANTPPILKAGRRVERPGACHAFRPSQNHGRSGGGASSATPAAAGPIVAQTPRNLLAKESHENCSRVPD
jgi:hypothetical protein